MRIDGRAQPTGIHKLGQDATLLLILNSYHEDVPFTLPETTGGDGWQRLLDTNLELAGDEETLESGSAYKVSARSVAVFTLTTEASLGTHPY